MATDKTPDALTTRPAPSADAIFDPTALEQSWYQWWEENGFFKANRDGDREPFTIMIPPPNVTGALHLGHALNNSIQDVLVRRARMQGKATLWQPGTDHAGIATQSVVERRLWADENKTRHDIGREAMVERIWSWKEEYEQRILGQLKRIGASADWSRTEFTMSPRLSDAVRYVFLTLFEDGLVYRGKKLINWSPGIQTALSNDELDYKKVKGHFWFFRYPLADDPKNYIEVATTRPETMLGDTAVAVHPDPEAELNKRLDAAKAAGNQDKIEALEARLRDDLPRLKGMAAMIGKQVKLPLVDRLIPIVGDAIVVDPEKGTGAVKITPAHDPNDYACGQRNDLPMINILNPDATLNEETGSYKGLHGPTEGRKKVVADMDALGLLTKVEDHEHEVAHCYRSGVPIEPYLSNQWFVKMQPLVDLARDCYTDGHVKFHPEHRGKDYLRWLDSTPDWCISRQLWWGHRIPIWYCLDCNPSIELDEKSGPKGHTIPEDAKPILPAAFDRDAKPTVCPCCGGSRLVQDPDVLDTWFSSQLWPLSTLGWPEETVDLDFFYPTSVLVTARDILALWVARMIMMGMKYKQVSPFSDVVLHGTIQDEHGNIMSKSRGNGFDPVRAIEGGSSEINGKDLGLKGEIPGHRIEHYPTYGADALRYGIFVLTSGHSQDLRVQIRRTERKTKENGLKAYDVEIPRLEEGRRFCNKIWQASRGVVFRQCQDYTHDDQLVAIEDRWLTHRLRETIEIMDKHLDKFELGEACEAIYTMFWDDFCSWYLEVIKPRLWGDQGEASKAQAQTHLVRALDTQLRLLHPFMPYLSECLWQELRLLQQAAGVEGLSEALIIADWPKANDFAADAEAAAITQTLRSVAGAVNQMRSQQPGINEGAKLPKLLVTGGEASQREGLASAVAGLSRFVKVEEIEIGEKLEKPALCATAVADGLELYLPLEGVIDVDAEIERLTKQIDERDNAIQRLEKQLGNEKFVARAPEAVVQQSRERLASEKEAKQVLQEQLQQLQQ